MTYEERTQLNNLSKLLYGKKSKWTSILKKGEESDMEEKMDDGTVRKYRGVKYLSVDELKLKMQNLWQEELARQEAKKESEKTIMQQYEENPKLDVFTDLEKEAIAQREMIKERAGSWKD